jgi:glyoxylase-like metal-dependent hydrolase (beta-lactamase superfamily II)
LRPTKSPLTTPNPIWTLVTSRRPSWKWPPGAMPCIALELTAVLLTHMDIDHDSGLRLVKEAPKILVSPEEIKAIHSHQVRYVKKPWKGIPLTPISWQEDPFAPFGKSFDVFGDGRVIAYLTPGHSEGSLCVKLRGEKGFALLVGDTGYDPASWEKGDLLGPLYDAEAMTKSLAWVKAQSLDPSCLGVFAAHDKAETRTHLSFSKNSEGFYWRLRTISKISNNGSSLAKNEMAK